MSGRSATESSYCWKRFDLVATTVNTQLNHRLPFIYPKKKRRTRASQILHVRVLNTNSYFRFLCSQLLVSRPHFQSHQYLEQTGAIIGTRILAVLEQ